MSTTVLDAPKTYRLNSSPFLNAPGLIAWAKNGYGFERDRKQMLDVITGAWSDLPRDTAAALLAGEIEPTVEGDTVIVVQPPVEPETETTTYHIRIGVTARVFAEDEFEAASWEDAVEKASRFDPRDFLYSYDREQGFDGDEIGYLIADDDIGQGDEHEVDLRDEGEPYSWEACEIVKNLAKLDAITDWPNDNEAQAAIGKLISRAHRACAKISGGMEG